VSVHKAGRHLLGQSALAAGVEVAEHIESLQQFGLGRRGMEFKMRQQQRRELTAGV
jgi:hypothetical protein